MVQSCEVLRKAIHGKGVKEVAGELGVSTSLVYKWCQEKDSESASGAENPLDRILKIVEITGETELVHWLCQKAGGFFVENPVEPQENSTPVLEATQRLLSEFSELLAAVSEGYNTDGEIDKLEAERIRKEWEDLKTLAERFVVACEAGAYFGGGVDRFGEG
jgi:transposase-like protein